MVESFAQRIGLSLSFDNSLIDFLNLSVNLSRNAAGLIGEAGIGLFEFFALFSRSALRYLTLREHL